MSHSRTSRRRTTRRRRYASRIGSPPVRRLPRSVRRRSTCSPRRWRSARRVRRIGAAIRSRVIRRWSASSSPGSSASKRLPRSRSSSLAATGTGSSPVAAPRSPDAIAAVAAPAGGAAPPADRLSARRSSGGAGVRRRSSSGAASGSITRDPNTSANTASKARTWAGSETSVARAVQYSRRRATGRTRSSAWANRAERSGVTGTPAACSRRAKPATTAGRSSSTVSTFTRRSRRAGRGRRRGPRPGPRRT